MRVDAYSKISKIYEPKAKTKVREVVKASGRDELTISSLGRDYQVARQAVAAAPDVREDRVNVIKSQMAAGTYQVSADSFAAKVIAKYEEMSF